MPRVLSENSALAGTDAAKIMTTARKDFIGTCGPRLSSLAKFHGLEVEIIRPSAQRANGGEKRPLHFLRRVATRSRHPKGDRSGERHIARPHHVAVISRMYQPLPAFVRPSFDQPNVMAPDDHGTDPRS
jgi:hypothetical protein